MKILFTPGYPDKEYYGLTQALQLLEHQVVINPLDNFDIAVVWDDNTHTKVVEPIRSILANKPTLNINCSDISKQHVERVFIQVFGYSSFIDPDNYTGKYVEKPNLNGVKGGRVCQCPISSQNPSMVYQQLIDSEQNGAQVEFRVPVIGDNIPIVYEVHQPTAINSLDNRGNESPILRQPSDIFSAAEQRDILSFCSGLGMDFGELDIVRCNTTHQIYILDANKTPAGYGLLNRFNWQPGVKKQAIKILADAFDLTIHSMLEPGSCPKSA